MSDMQGYQQSLASLYNDRKLDSIAYKILGFLNLFPHKAFPSHTFIAKKCGCSLASVKRKLKLLESLGYLKIISGLSKGTSNTYELNYSIIRPTHMVAHKEPSTATTKRNDARGSSQRSTRGSSQRATIYNNNIAPSPDGEALHEEEKTEEKPVTLEDIAKLAGNTKPKYQNMIFSTGKGPRNEFKDILDNKVD